MAKEFEEFKIEGRKEQFRVGKISPVDLLALTTQIDLKDFQQTKVLFNFALEHTEVKMGEKWLPVKVPGREVYQPMGIEEDMMSLNEIIMYMLNEVIAKTFTKSSR